MKTWILLTIALVLSIVVLEDNISDVEASNLENSITSMVDYQGPDLGIAFKYPSSWPSPTYPDYQNCFKNSDSCNVSFPLVNQDNYVNKNFIVGIGVNKLFTNSDPKSLLIPEKTCFCTTLHDYIKWDYNRLYKDDELLIDGQTNLGNQSSWQMDVVDKSNGYKTLVTWAINDNFGYRFIYSGPADNHFEYYLDEYKSLLDSVIFTKVGLKEPIEVAQSLDPKKPSFLSEGVIDSPITSSSPNKTMTNTSTLVGTSNNTKTDTTSTKLDVEKTVNSNATQDNIAPPLIFEDEFGSLFQKTTAFKTLTDNDLDFSIQYPTGWNIGDSSEHFTVADFNSPNDDVTVNVRIFPKGEYKSLKDYGDKNFKKSEDLTLLQYYRNSTTLLSEKPAVRAVYLTTSNPGLFGEAFGYTSSTSKAMMVATMVPEKKSIYAVAYFADSNNFERYLPVVEDMIESFQIGTKGPVIQEED